jgi:hypothetical protein
MKINFNSTNKDFGLIIGLVITLISIIGILLITINPIQESIKGRDYTRRTHINRILTALHQYIIDNDGELPPAMINSTIFQIGICKSGGNTICTEAAEMCLDLSKALRPYLGEIPLDPKGGTTNTSYYSVKIDSHGLITVNACNSESPNPIKITK